MKRLTYLMRLLSAVAVPVAGAAVSLVAVAERTTAAAPALRKVDLAQIALVDVDSNRRLTLRDLAGPKATLVFFSSNECPVALTYEQELALAWPGLEQRGVRLVAVSSSYADSREAIN